MKLPRKSSVERRWDFASEVAGIKYLLKKPRPFSEEEPMLSWE